MTRTAGTAVACLAICAAMAGQGRAADLEATRAAEASPARAKAVHPAPSSKTSKPALRSKAGPATAGPKVASSAPRSTPIANSTKRPQAGAASSAPLRSATRSGPTRQRAAAPVAYASRPEVQAYIDDLVAREHFDRDALLRLFADAHYSDTAARLLAPSSAAGVRRDWNAYRARFIDPVRLDAGYRFWDVNADTLARAEKEFGVPPEIIVGIVGVETVYGRNTGTFRVIDVLSTLAFDFPVSPGRDRSAFFREQLTDALAMDRDGMADLASLRGSYAGAIGMPQFMPGSIRRYAIDYDRDGRIDLAGSPADVIGSVANFLVQQGWVRDLPTHVVLTHPGRSTRRRHHASMRWSTPAACRASSCPTSGPRGSSRPHPSCPRRRSSSSR